MAVPNRNDELLKKSRLIHWIYFSLVE